jgi:transcriptional regulator with XRE-family HTH domain
MKTNALFEKCLAEVNPAIKAEVELNMDIANKIDDILKAKGMTQRELATKMGKKESEISRWLTGTRGFTTRTIAAISAALDEQIVTVNNPTYVLLPYCSFNTVTGDDFVDDGVYIASKKQFCNFERC